MLITYPFRLIPPVTRHDSSIVLAPRSVCFISPVPLLSSLILSYLYRPCLPVHVTFTELPILPSHPKRMTAPGQLKGVGVGCPDLLTY